MKSSARWHTAAFSMLGVFLLLLLLANTEIAMDGVRRGLTLCNETLIPSLFPFLVLSELLIALGAGGVLGRFLGRPVSLLFGLSPNGAVSYLLGTLCGFPVATTTAISSFERGELEKEEVERLVLFANNPSSGFLIAAVGKGLFGNTSSGIALFCITLLSSALLGIALHFLLGAPPKKERTPTNGMGKPLSTRDFTESIRRGFSTLLQVSAFVLFFSCVASCILHTFRAFSLPAPLGVVLCGVFELTCGISEAVTALPAALAFRAAAFFASFSGISVCLQIFAVAQGKGVRLSRYLFCKLLQGSIALLLTEAYLYFFRPVFVPVESTAVFSSSNKSLLILSVSLLLVLLTLWLHKRAGRKQKGSC